MTRFVFAVLTTIALAACGGAETKPAEVDHSPLDHASAEKTDGEIGHSTGTVRAVNADANSLTIDHGPIEGIGMGAMTMGFSALDSVDVSGFSEGDEVAFMIKVGRDGSYRITNICDTATDGADCLHGAMDH